MVPLPVDAPKPRKACPLFLGCGFSGWRTCSPERLKGPYLVKYSLHPGWYQESARKSGKAGVGWVCSGMHLKAWLKEDTPAPRRRGERCSIFELASRFQSLPVGPAIHKLVVGLLSLGKIMHKPAS